MGFITKIFNFQNLKLAGGGILGSMADDTVDKLAERVPAMVRAPIKFVGGAMMLTMGGNIGQGAGVVTMTNALQDVVGKAKMPGKST